MKLLIINFIFTLSFAQLTLIHNGIEREYYVSYPTGVDEPCALIITMHNYYGSALFIQDVSEMDEFALPENIAVVYPEGINNSWNVGTPWDGNNQDDIGFVDVLIDSVAANYAIDLDRVYACGYSNGGYLAYELACELSHKITAFGSIGGNFMLNQDQECSQERDIPIIHFHGTDDPYVAYDEAFPGQFSNDGSMLINENINYWVEHNDLTSSNFEELPDLVVSDNTTVEKQTYFGETTSAQFVHYKVNNGGHQWFGADMGDPYIIQLGNNNHDIHASELLVEFFLNYRLSEFIIGGTLGDLNSDGLINVNDIILTVQILLGQLEMNPLADLNDDGMINVQDVIIIVNMILG